MNINDKFNRLTYLGAVPLPVGVKKVEPFGSFQCDCGKIITARLWGVKTGHTKSCGCLQLEKLCIAQTAHKKAYGEAGKNYVLYQIKRGATSRGLEFSLTDDQVYELSQSNCYYCGAPPSMRRNTKTQNGVYIYNGLDRVDNSKGYTLDNVVTCCITCNRMKMAHTKTKFLDKVKQIYEHLKL